MISRLVAVEATVAKYATVQKEGELPPEATRKDFLTVRRKGPREVHRRILSCGRVPVFVR